MEATLPPSITTGNGRIYNGCGSTIRLARLGTGLTTTRRPGSGRTAVGAASELRITGLGVRISPASMIISEITSNMTRRKLIGGRLLASKQIQGDRTFVLSLCKYR